MKNSSGLKKLYNSKIFWMIVSLLMSLVIWVYVTSTQVDPTIFNFNNVQVVLTGEDALLESRGCVVTDLDTNTVSVRISGTRGNIGTLSEDDIKAVVDVSKLNSGRVTMPYTLVYPENVDASAVTRLSSSPNTVSFIVATVDSKPVPVKGAFVGKLAEGYIAEELVFEPETVLISGADSLLSQIDHVYATIGGENVSKTRNADVPFVLMDKEGNELDLRGLDFDTDTVRVTLPISAKKDVSLSVSVIEGGGATEGSYTVSIEPQTITISGDTAIVDGINKIDLGTIDLTDFETSHEFTFPIVLDNGVENVTGVSEATVRVEIIGLETKKLSVTNLTFIDLPQGYSAEILNRSLEVTIRGTAEALANVKANNIRAVADLSEIATTGDISVPVKIYVADAGAGAVGDYKVTVSIKN